MLEQLSLGKIVQEVKLNRGLDLSSYSNLFVERRIGSRMRRLNLASLEDYYNYIRTHKEEISAFIRDMSIHVTHFFRDKAMYDVFMLETMMDLLKRKDKAGGRTINVWSAGCSSGEEAYSIAITMLELLGTRSKDFRINITGTDIDHEAIESAKLGIYEQEAFRETPPEILSRYFVRLPDGRYQISSSVKSLASFSIEDMLTGAKPRNMDVIFCRNVVIYFSKEVKEKLYEDFYLSLNQGGLLIIGKTETLIGPAREKFLVKSITERIFEKPSL